MNKFNRNEFSHLLKESLEKRTQKQFASEIGVSSEYLNRLINKKYKNPPSEDFLNKVSKNTKKVSLDQLLKSCGYIYNTNALPVTSQDLLLELIEIIKTNSQKAKKDLIVFDSVSSMLSKLNENFYFLLTYDIIETNNDKILVKSRISYDNKIVELYYVINYIKTDHGQFIAKNILITKDKIDLYFNFNFNIKGQIANDDNYYYKYIKLKEEYDTIISNSDSKNFIDTIKGYGFRVSNSDNLKDKSHEDLRSLAKRISNETGVNIVYVEDDLIEENNAIVYITDNPPSSIIKNIFKNYKSKLGINVCGFCYIYKQRTVNF